MPELPDLEIYAHNLSNRFCQKTITDFNVFKPQKVSACREEILLNLQGHTLKDIERNGKEAWFKFSNGAILAIHLMLKGRFEIAKSDQQTTNKIIALKFQGDEFLIVSDPLSWANVTLNPAFSPVPDAMDLSFNVPYLKEKLFKKKSSSIKELLTNQKIVRGIGNAYADEILWDCKVSPFSKCGSLPDDVVQAIYISVVKVLRNAIQELYKIVPDAINGEYREFLNVHNPNKNFTSSGYRIKTAKIGSRTTYYTDEQILYE
jgi:formamidopyrimidine-DNA glycosylase